MEHAVGTSGVVRGSARANFFDPLHVCHIREYLAEVEAYLALEPGFRFLLAGSHVDVWRDESLLDV